MSVDHWEDYLDALANRYRRRLLVTLLEREPQDGLDPRDIVSSVDEPVHERELVHLHLPKLEEMGFIEWDREHGRVRAGPNWDDFAPLVQLLKDHREELPDGWH